MAGKERHPVGLKQLADAVGQALHDGVLALEHDGIVEAHVVGNDAEIGAVLHHLEHFGTAQHGFGRDAAPVEAHAAGALLFDQRDAQTVLRGADGRRVAAWATADDDKVKGALLSHD